MSNQGSLQIVKMRHLTGAAPQDAVRDGTAEFNISAHGLRGIASLMVMAAHIIGGTARHIYPNSLEYVSAVAPPWNLGVFGVKLFFLISGFVILPSAFKYSAREFALRRLLRIYPLFLVASILFIILNAITNLYPQVNDPGSIVAALLFLNLFTGTEQLTPNAWSLSYEVVFYILTAASVATVVKQVKPAAALAVTVASIAFVVAFPVALFFILGCLIRVLSAQMIQNKIALRTLEAVAFIGLVSSASGGFFEYRLEELKNPTAMSALLCSAIYFWTAVDARSVSSAILKNKVLMYYGTISYSMYIVHPYVYYLCRSGFQRYHLFTSDIWGSVLVFGIVVFIISTAVSHVSHKVLEQWPYRQYFRQRIFHTG